MQWPGIVPFTASEFLDVFAAYNQALWPFAALLWLLTALVGSALVLGRSIPAVLLRGVLAGHWLWAGLMYHALYFSAINPAAWLFAAFFVAQGILFLALESSFLQPVERAAPARRVVSSLLIVYGLMYPVVVWADGFTYPRMPAFGVPCPTVIFTIGVFLASTPTVLLSVIPVGWSAIAGTAAWLFGVHADFVLPTAGGVLVFDLILRRSHVMRKLSFASLFIVLVALLVFVPASTALAQAGQHDHEQQAAQKSRMKMDGMKMDHKMMGEMAAKKKANTERLTTLMAQVKGSTGEAKVAAMADVIGVLFEERTAMQEHCAAMMAMMKK